MREITVDWLLSRAACVEQVALFEATFGPSAPLTAANLRRAADAGLDLDWLSVQLLDAPAMDEFWRASVAAMDEYDRATIAAHRDLDRAESEEGEAAALAEFDRAFTAAIIEYQRAIAPALIAALGLPPDAD